MPYVARKRVTVLGVAYDPQHAVPLDRAPPKVAHQLLDQRRIVWKDENVPDENVQVVHRGARWFDVVVGGKVVNEKGLGREDADALAARYGLVHA